MLSISKLFEISGNENDSLAFLKNFQSLHSEKFALIYLPADTLLDSFNFLIFELELLLSLNLFPIILIKKDVKDYVEVFLQKQNSFSFIEFSETVNEKISLAIQAKHIPFIYLENDLNLFSDSSRILNAFETRKLIYLDLNAPFKNQFTNEKISMISLRNKFEESSLSTDHQKLFEMFKSIFELIKYEDFSFIYTSPFTLLKELFTIKGSGTYIKQGSNLISKKSLTDIDKKKLDNLLSVSYNKTLRKDFTLDNFNFFIIEKNYKAAAIFIEKPFGNYLSKFAVDAIAKGEGVGRDIWDEMKMHYSKIFWRAKTNNPINKWYRNECDGFIKLSNWNLYWIGIESDSISLLKEFVMNLDEDFTE